MVFWSLDSSYTVYTASVSANRKLPNRKGEQWTVKYQKSANAKGFLNIIN